MIGALISTMRLLRTAGISLQPGPAALTDGLDAIMRIIDEWHARRAVTARTPA
jgi:hypothetical protein